MAEMLAAEHTHRGSESGSGGGGGDTNATAAAAAAATGGGAAAAGTEQVSDDDIAACKRLYGILSGRDPALMESLVRTVVFFLVHYECYFNESLFAYWV